ncbi:hypothetical protein AAEX37_01662 [Oligella sp. MSHR50489EDL]
MKASVINKNSNDMTNKNLNKQIVLPDTDKQERYPRRLKLFAGMMYEGLLLFALIFVGAYLFDTLTQSHEAEPLMWQRQLVLFILLGAYFLISWFKRGQTVAMKAWGIRLINKRHPRLTWVQAITRYLLMWVLPLIGAFIVNKIVVSVGWHSISMFIVICPFLNLLPTLFRKDRQMLHDVLAGTELINSRK